jgi:hypothetical protein
MPTRFSAAFLAFLIAAVSPRLTNHGAALAQNLTGRVSDSLSGQVLSGAVVIVLDARGASLLRRVTDELGRYRFDLPREAARIEVRRIGFRPASANVSPNDADRSLDFRLTRVPSLLEPVRVLDNASCPRRRDREAAFALWDQMRSALLATIAERDFEPPVVQRLAYDRVLDDRDRIVKQSVRADSTTAGRAFSAVRSAAGFANNGFVADSGGSRVFLGPDADALVDDEFLRSYCLSIAAASAEHAGRVGLAFEPARRVLRRIDIAGVVWIDTVRRSVDELEFRYRGLESYETALRPGGWISFRTMANGVPFIDRWYLRVVVPPDKITERGYVPRWRLEVHEGGGEMAAARWTNRAAWRAQLGTVQGRLLRSGKPLANTGVRLAESPYRAVSDSAGSFRIDRLLPGPYDITVEDDLLRPAGVAMATSRAFVAVRDSTVDLDVDAPTLNDFVRAQCKTKLDSMLLLAAQVVWPDGKVASFADARLSQASDVMVDDDGFHRLQGPPEWASVWHGETGVTGRFYVCDLPRRALLRLDVEHDGATARWEFTTSDRGRLVYANRLVLPPKKP